MTETSLLLFYVYFLYGPILKAGREEVFLVGVVVVVVVV